MSNAMTLVTMIVVAFVCGAFVGAAATAGASNWIAQRAEQRKLREWLDNQPM